MVQESKRHWQRLEQNAQKQQKVRQERAVRHLDIQHWMSEIERETESEIAPTVSLGVCHCVWYVKMPAV